jgi:hypothetical protein
MAMGIIGRITGKLLFFFADSRSGKSDGDDPLPDPDREYLINLHRELERTGAMAIMERYSQPAARSAATCPLKDVTSRQRIEIQEIVLPDTRILPLKEIQEIVMAEIGQEA